MTAEEKRERLLRRILPGMVIAVLYFVFLSHWVTKGVVKAKADRQALNSRGIAPEALPAVAREQKQIDAEIQKLAVQKAEFGKQVNAYAGFLFDPAYASHLNDRLATLLAAHHLREVGSDIPPDNKEVSRSILDVYNLIGEAPGKKSRISIWRVSFTGSYLDVYRLLMDLQAQTPAVIPAALTMKPAPDDRMGMAWSLSFWVGVGAKE
jgi:hypothetical protein